MSKRKSVFILNFAFVLLTLFSCTKEPEETGAAGPVVRDPNIFGKVCDNGGKALGGVVVSDGFTCVKTDANGEYALASDLQKAKHVFVVQPDGYRASVENGLSTFYKTLGKGGAQQHGGKYTVNFTLEKITANPDKYTVIMSADPQPRAKSAVYDNIAYHSLDCVSDMVRDMKEYTSTLSGSNLCGIILGDIVHENMSLFGNMTDMLKDFPYPTYAVIGNHDNNTASADDNTGASSFEQYFGPRNYSFNLGKVHFVVLDNLIMEKDDKGALKSYGQGLTDDVWNWLQSDLQYVDAATPVMVCSHSPMFHLAGGGERYESKNTRHGYDYANLFGSFNKVYAWAGHVHNMFNYIPEDKSITASVETHTLSRVTGDLWTNEWVCSDGTPRGYVVINIDGDNVSWQFKPVQYQSNAASGAKLPDYKRMKVTDNVIYTNGKKISPSYQMRAYPRGAYGGNYVYVNVFMWDAKWGNPQFTGSDGAKTTMTRVTDSKLTYDLEAYDIYNHYKTKNSSLKRDSGYDYDKSVGHLFRCYSNKTSDSGTISVTDRFGNTYSTSVSW